MADQRLRATATDAFPFRLVAGGQDPLALLLREARVPLESFSASATWLRCEEDDSTMNLDRPAWNHSCADLLHHVASLIP